MFKKPIIIVKKFTKISKIKKNHKVLKDSTKKKTKLYLFFHMATMNGETGRWQKIYEEIKDSLEKSGLLYKFDKIFQYNLGKDKAPKLTDDAVYVNAGEDFSLYEFPTIIGLKKYCDRNDDSYVLYIHSKGVSVCESNREARKKDWQREIAISSHIDKWEKCVQLLETCDVVSTHWDRKHQCFICNFWWSKSFHIKKLPMPIIKIISPRSRYYCEHWLFTNIKMIKKYDLNKEKLVEDV